MANKATKILMPFNVGDWLGSEVRRLPLDVRGLYVDLLCYMWESVERGVMMDAKGQPYSRRGIVQLVGVDMSGTDAWLDVLVDNGLCSVRASDGAYCCNKMLREEDIRAKRREAGKRGGEVTKAKMFSSSPEPEVKEDLVVKVQTPTCEESVPKKDTQGQDGLFQVDDVPTESPPPLTPEQKAKIEKAKKYKYAEFVTLTRDEYTKLCVEYGEEPALEMIEILNNYKGSKGRRYKSDYLAIRGWVKDKYYENLQKYGNKVNERAAECVTTAAGSSYQDTL